MKRYLAIAFLFAAVTSAPTVTADVVYKWTDADGNVHYEDRPSANASAELLQISSNRTNRNNVQARVQQRQESRSARQDADTEAAKQAQIDAQEKDDAQKREHQCAAYKANLENLQNAEGGRLYRYDDTGERVYLDDKQRTEARQHAEDMVQEYCNS